MKCIFVFTFAFALAVVVSQCEGKTFTRCGLVRELKKQGFPQNQLRDWVCLVENESGRRTDVVVKNKNLSSDYGLFQINDAYWCSNTTTPGKDCYVTCADLITDDITKASRCAKTVYERHEFDAWNGWKKRCRGSLPDISNC